MKIGRQDEWRRSELVETSCCSPFYWRNRVILMLFIISTTRPPFEAAATCVRARHLQRAVRYTSGLGLRLGTEAQAQGHVLRLRGGGRIARERLGIVTPKKWESNKLSRGQGVSKRFKSRDSQSSNSHGGGKRGAGDGKLSKEDKEKLKTKKKSYVDLIKRSKVWRADRQRVKLHASSLREEMDAELKEIRHALSPLIETAHKNHGSRAPPATCGLAIFEQQANEIATWSKPSGKEREGKKALLTKPEAGSGEAKADDAQLERIRLERKTRRKEEKAALKKAKEHAIMMRRRQEAEEEAEEAEEALDAAEDD